MRSRFHTTAIHVGLLVAIFALSGCFGSGVEGTYTGGDEGIFDSLTFKSDGKVEITAFGMPREGTFVVEDNQVKVTASGDTAIFTIQDDGCLHGGGLVGRYCKGRKD